MWQKRRFACSRLLVLLLVVQQTVMASQTANMAQLKNQQHQQQATSSQQHQHHAPAPLQQQHHQQQQQHQQSALTSTTHPGSSSSGSSNTGHHLGLASQSAALASSSVASSSSSSPTSAHMPPAQFINDKEAAVQEVLQHFTADDDLNETYQMLNELKREVNSASGLSAQAQPPPPPPPRGSAGNYPWNLFERGPAYPSSPYSTLPIPSISPFAGLFPHMFNPYEGYHASAFPVTPRFMPFMSYAQPILVPYPFYMAPEMFYPGYSSPLANEFDDAMSRGASAGASRRPSSPLQQQSASGYPRNSPIYYVRLPPTPYMFLPSLGLGAATSAAAMSGYPAMMPYQSLSSFPSFSSLFNVPINFLANGKPNSIYQMGGGSTNDIQSPVQFSNIATNYQNHPSPPPPPSHSAGNGYRPTSSTHNYMTSPSHSAASSNHYGSYPAHASGISMPPAGGSSPQSIQDSKLTSLKRPYFFNGRPEDIYILPNNFNSLYSSENSYY